MINNNYMSLKLPIIQGFFYLWTLSKYLRLDVLSDNIFFGKKTLDV